MAIAPRLFITCWLVYVLHFATNTVREIYPALSLGDHFSVDVSEYMGLHPDIFQIPGRGAFINNNPGASFMGAIPYALARPVIDPLVAAVNRARAAAPTPSTPYESIYPMAREFTEKAREKGLDVKFGLGAAVMQAFLMAPLSALAVVVMFYILQSLVSSTRTALWLSLLYAFATPVFYRTAQLNQNLLVADCAWFAFALLWRPWSNDAGPRPWHYMLAGLLAGWAVVLDYSGLVVLGAISLYAFLRHVKLSSSVRSRTDLVVYAMGVIASVCVLLAYQWLAFGNPFLPAQHYMPPTSLSGYGINGMGLPQIDLLWDTAFGIRFGLFISAPLLILALFIPGWFSRKVRLVGGIETWFILLFSIAFFLFSSASEYGRLQFNSGVRYIVPVTSFLFLLAAGVLLRMPRWISITLGIIGTFWSWSLAMYRDVEQGWGVFESLIHITSEGVRLPWLTTLERMGYVPGGWAWLLLALSAVVVWGIWKVDPATLKLVAWHRPSLAHTSARTEE